MVCEQFIKEFEKRLGRKLTKEEKKKIQEKMHHSEILDNGRDKGEEEIGEEILVPA